MISRRNFLGGIGTSASLGLLRFGTRTFDVATYGATGSGTTSDTAAIQRAIDAAAAHGKQARVLLRGGNKRYLTGTLALRSHIDFYLAEDAALVASTDPREYSTGANPAILTAQGVAGLRITGGGHIDGQALRFMTSFVKQDERWSPGPLRPGIFILRSCQDLEVTGISFGDASFWGLHMLGCERVLVDRLTIRNRMDVPNCDGIDPDHCRDVTIRNCDIVSADDAICVKTTRQPTDFGPSTDIRVSDCVLTTRDSGIKIGTETYGDISNVRFDRCKILSGGRGPTITLRDAGHISDIEFNDIDVVAQHHAAEWWGWGEAISLTVRPRHATASLGTLRNVRLRNIRARAENSARIDGMTGNPIADVLLENFSVTIDRWTGYPGGHFDNRPASPGTEGLEAHNTPAYSIRNATGVTLNNCSAAFGPNRQPSFSSAVEAENAPNVHLNRFTGEAADPTHKAIDIH